MDKIWLIGKILLKLTWKLIKVSLYIFCELINASEQNSTRCSRYTKREASELFRNGSISAERYRATLNKD